jgi:hypothetical protein
LTHPSATPVPTGINFEPVGARRRSLNTLSTNRRASRPGDTRRSRSEERVNGGGKCSAGSRSQWSATINMPARIGGLPRWRRLSWPLAGPCHDSGSSTPHRLPRPLAALSNSSRSLSCACFRSILCSASSLGGDTSKNPSSMPPSASQRHHQRPGISASTSAW